MAKVATEKIQSLLKCSGKLLGPPTLLPIAYLTLPHTPNDDELFL